MQSVNNQLSHLDALHTMLCYKDNPAFESGVKIKFRYKE